MSTFLGELGTLTPKELLHSLAKVLGNSPELISALANERVSNDLSEKLMLVVTSVYQCRYCNWMHSDLAALFGVEDSEISKLLVGDLSSVALEEKAAVTFALKYAQADDESSLPYLKSSCLGSYSDQTATDIAVLVDFVRFTNKLGNTFDAFIAFALRQQKKDISPFFSGAIFLTMLPLYSGVAAFSSKGRWPFFSLQG